MNSLAIGDKLQAIKEIAIGGCEDIEVSEKIFDLCDEILGLVNSASCNCQHNSNSRDNESCCRCDSRKTNADKIRNMSDEELAEFNLCPHMVNWKKGNYDTCVHPNDKDACKKCMLDWLRSKAEQERIWNTNLKQWKFGSLRKNLKN